MTKETARKALDKKIAALPSLQQMQRPHKGWTKAIREALGMTTSQLAKRLGVSQPRITSLEKAELDGTVTLATLRRAAEALDCALVYSFVPKKSLQETVKDRARLVAAKLIGKVDHTMSLEAQNLNKFALDEEIEELAEQIIREKKRILWDELK
tara:strand:- start:171 stop:632 length:462 start_codon:yes stop_codon:yes gene_type:complete